MNKLLLFPVSVFFLLSCTGNNVNTESISSLTAKALTDEQAVSRLRDLQLEKYKVELSYPAPDSLGLLAGNAEMGGVVTCDGLGAERIFRADFYKTSVNRFPLTGIWIEPFEGSAAFRKNIREYRQTLNLKDGIVSTHVVLNNDKGGYDAEVFFMNDPLRKNLFVVHIKPFGRAKEIKWQVKLPLEFAVNPDFKKFTPWGGEGFQYRLQLGDSDLFIARSVTQNKVEAEARQGMLGVKAPVNRYTHYYDKDGYIAGSSFEKNYTPLPENHSLPVWKVICNRSMTKTEGRGRYLLGRESDEITLLLGAASLNWTEFTAEENAVMEKLPPYQELIEHQRAAWKCDWNKTPVIITPDERFNMLYYRSLFWTLCQAGSKKFLPGEAQFASDCWAMAPFTYGFAGFAVHALYRMGHPERAENMIRNFIIPDALKNNGKVILERESRDAMCFPHMMDNQANIDWPTSLQQHVTGFGICLLQLPFIFEKSTDATEQYGRNNYYPVLKGCAQFWMELDSKWIEKDHGYIYTRKMNSVAENIVESSPLDLILAAKWVLRSAADYADLLNVDSELSKQWRERSEKLILPTLKTEDGLIYAQFYGDKGSPNIDVYQGVRAPLYLAFPTDYSEILNKDMCTRTISHAFIQNNKGIGAIGFINNWYAIAEARYGFGDHALKWLVNDFDIMEKRTGCLYEYKALNRLPQNPYFGTNQAAFLVALSEMISQTDGKICKVFPAVPSEWKDIVVLNMPAGCGKRFSSILKGGKISGLQLEGKLIKVNGKSAKMDLSANKN